MADQNFLRLAWEISGYGKGHGDWHDAADTQMLQSHVDAGNEKYGAGTHRIETTDGLEALRETEALINRTKQPMTVPR